jgi:drug/metabolite transporter (DMT)-like permease
MRSYTALTGRLDMRYVLMALGAIGLAVGFLMFANAHHPDHMTQATVVVQLGGIFLAVGTATTDIVEAIKASRR